MCEFIRAADTALFKLINSGWHSPALDQIMIAITWFGAGVTQAGIALVVLLVGFAADRVDLRRASYAGMIALISCLALSPITKRLWDRPRPVLAMFDVRLADTPLFSQSFPSGHAMAAFAAMAVYWVFFPKLRWALAPLAFATAISRVYLGVHFPLDVIYGALVGTLLGVVAARIVRARTVGESYRTVQS